MIKIINKEYHRKFQNLRVTPNVVTEEDAGIMREDLRRMHEWAKDWQMLFNAEKCIVMRMGKDNGKFKYDMGGE